MNKNILLSCMIGLYLLPILYVLFSYNLTNHSICSIICNDTAKYYIFFFMGLMGIFSLLYEIERDDIFSIIFIYEIVIGIYGIILINETYAIHYVFAFIIFLSILFFMIRQYFLVGNTILLISLIFQFITLLYIIKNIYKNIFYGEIIYVLNFAFYYLYLHFK